MSGNDDITPAHLGKFHDFTADELDRLVEEADSIYTNGWRDFKYEEYDDSRGIYFPEIAGWVSTLATYGGEGQGDDYWVVVKVTPGTVLGPDAELGAPRYFKKPGYYASYSGGYLDGNLIEVRPREKMITVYE